MESTNMEKLIGKEVLVRWISYSSGKPPEKYKVSGIDRLVRFIGLVNGNSEIWCPIEKIGTIEIFTENNVTKDVEFEIETEEPVEIAQTVDVDDFILNEMIPEEKELLSMKSGYVSGVKKLRERVTLREAVEIAKEYRSRIGLDTFVTTK